ncbi:hypothetical protein AGABI2DRAFT_119332 [Agaricus bisporus var. bisporus H97]|uniref:hypothetical protein n=1 Tax=Agaricus bisporus var. bisporus (strain H97 / ATCC MYA-4626 / FGSC 10389) TaxID=936046 RepID=UPI00029F7F1D|nr:hypothetical protein AGABI2DRAFT_119332 [Agaricus bisporus var. bisporus H97]EKV45654.1 hypothetical protein AGABI2DRAFT_119332 [Agaricus bisporus var. bisporus H97]
MDQNKSNNSNNSNRDSHDADTSATLSTDSLLSTNTTSSTVNPLSSGNPPPKDYSAALSILQSRYGTGGYGVPTPKPKPSDKIQKLNAVQESTVQGGSQLTLVSTSSVPNSSTSEGTSTTAGSSSTVNAASGSDSQSQKPRRKIGIASLFKGGNTPATIKS